MSESMWVRSHVERLLQEEWDVCRARTDSDGDYPWHYRTVAGWVSVLEIGDEYFVRVWAHAAFGVKQSAKLLTELNEIQLQCTSAVVMLRGSTVVVHQTLPARDLTQRQLAQALMSVRAVGDDIGTLVATVYGGQTPFPPPVEVEEEEDAA